MASSDVHGKVATARGREFNVCALLFVISTSVRVLAANFSSSRELSFVGAHVDIHGVIFFSSSPPKLLALRLGGFRALLVDPSASTELCGAWLCWAPVVKREREVSSSSSFGASGVAAWRLSGAAGGASGA